MHHYQQRDQMRFEDENGDWIDFDNKFPSNHRGTYKECGEWAVPVFPSNISLQGSVKTPYIWDDRISPEDLTKAMLEVYNTPKKDRKKKGLKGREWAMSEEAKFTADLMSKNISDAIDDTIENFKPRSRFDLIKVEDIKPKYVEHSIYNY